MGAERDTLESRRLEVANVPREARLDPIGIALAQLVRPLAAAGVELAGGVSLDPPRQLLELDPEEAASVRSPRGVDSERLTDDDGRLGGEQSALGLVDGARDTVEAGRDVDDRGSREPLVAVPARWLGERVVDLHLRAAVAEAPCALGHRLGNLHVGEQPFVELGRRDARHDGALGLDRLAVGEAHAYSAARADERAFDVAVRLAGSPVVADELHERVRELRAAAAGYGHPALLHRDRDHLGHEAGRRLVGAETRVEHPRRKQAVRALRREGRLEPVPARLEYLGRKG